MSAKAETRIEKAKKDRPGFFGAIKRNPTAQREVQGVHCKGCGAPLMSYRETGHEEHKVINGHRIVYRQVVLGPTPQYDTLLIECDDGSAHETPICKTCKPKIGPDDLEAIYAADLEEWERDGAQVSESHAKRKPVRVAR